MENWCISYLKFKLGATEVGPLLLPEVVWFNDEGDVDAGRKRLLQDLQKRLDAVPLGAAHIHDDGEAMFTHLLAGMEGGRREWEELKDEGREEMGYIQEGGRERNGRRGNGREGRREEKEDKRWFKRGKKHMHVLYCGKSVGHTHTPPQTNTHSETCER